MAMLVGACGPSPRPTSVPDGGGNPSAPSSPGGSCPAIDYAALESDDRNPDTRTIALTRVFQREEARADLVIAPAPFDLDVMRIARPGPPPGKMGGGFGLGWEGFDARWVAAATSPEVEAPLAAWTAAWKVLADHQRGSYLLDQRVRFAGSVEPPAAWGGLRCVEEAAARAERDETKAGEEVERTEQALRGVLEGLPSLRPGDELLLGMLLADRLPHPHDPKDAERPIALFTKVVRDEANGRELRARAAEQLARVQGPGVESFGPALEQVLALTEDPALKVETLVKLADVAEYGGDDARAESLRMQVMELFERPNGALEHQAWRKARILGELAEARLERGAFEQARADAARCAQETVADFPREPDPWGCAPTLAEAMAELAEAPAGVEVPLAFLGPLAIASMDSALARRDHEQAEHAGMLLLSALPQAAQVPEAIAMLMGIVQTEEERARLAEKKLAEYAREGQWTEAQRQRLAWDLSPAAVEEELAALMNPRRSPVVVRLPQAPIELTEDLRTRATLAGEACADVLGSRRRPVQVSVDTRGTTPVVTVKGAKTAAEACLLRATASRFRSVGPVRTSFGVALE
ncbi:hypothetical protein [Paraliomyxa miuraensis]|uniref:hypothetical protein n=1 Tax=Paraliomyxa miuraensis TaxID=376150 RepID=UPI00224F3595|nr:hypothetical protein [Paraliomyxa miuraensis]MCX4244980.1 hypothetical protein [Paraliomyxa miuraensis]